MYSGHSWRYPVVEGHGDRELEVDKVNRGRFPLPDLQARQILRRFARVKGMALSRLPYVPKNSNRPNFRGIVFTYWRV